VAKRMATAGIGAAGTPEFSILPVTICISPLAYLPGEIRRSVLHGLFGAGERRPHRTGDYGRARTGSDWPCIVDHAWYVPRSAFRSE